MANYKMVNTDQLDADLSAVADAIRERAGATETMVFPNGFVSAVEGIPNDLDARVNGSIQYYRSETLQKMSNSAFAGCGALKTVILPNVASISGFSFQNCFSLSVLDTGAGKIETMAFSLCMSLKTVILRSDKVATLEDTNAFSNNTPIHSGTGYIYVPKALVDSYKSATNWSNYANQIRAIEDYPEITGGAT